MCRSRTRTSGREPLDRLERGRDVAGLAHHLEPRLRLDEQPQAAADHNVIVGEDDGERLLGLRGRVVSTHITLRSFPLVTCRDPSRECRRVSDPRAVSATAVATSERLPVARGPLLSGLSVSHPSTTYTQAELLELLGLDGDEFAEAIFARSGVRTRRLSLSRESLGQSLQARAAATEEQIFDMAVAALGGLDFDPADVGVLVTAGYWSIGGPSLAHRLIDQFGLGPRTDKYHVTGVGCASAVPLLRLAGQLLRDRPGERALVVAAESVSGFMTGALPGDERTKVVGLGAVRRRLRRSPPRSCVPGAGGPGDRRERRPPAARLARPGSLHGERARFLHADRARAPADRGDPPALARRGLPRSERPRQHGHRPLAAASGRPRDPRGRAARPWVVGRSRLPRAPPSCPSTATWAPPRASSCSGPPRRCATRDRASAAC